MQTEFRGRLGNRKSPLIFYGHTLLWNWVLVTQHSTSRSRWLKERGERCTKYPSVIREDRRFESSGAHRL